MVFHGPMSDSNSPQVSSNLLSILAGLNNAVALMLFTCPRIYKSFSSFTNLLGIALSTPITIDIIIIIIIIINIIIIIIIIIAVVVFVIIIYSLDFSHHRKLMVFHSKLSDSKSPQASRTLLNILAVFNNAVVWMVSTRSLTSKSSRLFNNHSLRVFLFSCS